MQSAGENNISSGERTPRLKTFVLSGEVLFMRDIQGHSAYAEVSLACHDLVDGAGDRFSWCAARR